MRGGDAAAGEAEEPKLGTGEPMSCSGGLPLPAAPFFPCSQASLPLCAQPTP